MQLHKGVIDLWLGDFAADVKRNEYYRQLLDTDEQQRVARIKHQRYRSQQIETLGRLREILARYLNVEASEVKLAKEKYGKPIIVGDTDIVFNLSHSSDKLIVAVGLQCQLGVDIEVMRQREQFAGLVKRCFAKEERTYWGNLPETEKASEFYRFWTRKEAFVKAVGRGIALGMEQVVISPEVPTRIVSIPEQYGSGTDWRIMDLDLNEGVIGAMAVRGTEITVRMRRLL
jgi:4'-phosphopantetheinyl transferase